MIKMNEEPLKHLLLKFKVKLNNILSNNSSEVENIISLCKIPKKGSALDQHLMI